MWRLFVSTLFGTAFGSVTDPCWSAGFSLVKRYSACVDGFCEGLFVDRRGNVLTSISLSLYDPLGCGEASAIVEEIRRDIGSSPTMLSESFHLLRSLLTEAVERLINPVKESIISNGRISNDTLQFMSSVHDCLMKISGIDESRQSLLDALVHSRFANIVLGLFEMSIEDFRSIPLDDRVGAERFAHVGHFVLDVMSVLNGLFDLRSLPDWTDTVSFLHLHRPGHRALHRMEMRLVEPALVTVSSDGATRLVDELDSWSSPGFPMNVWSWLYHFHSDDSTVSSFLADYVKNTLCASRRIGETIARFGYFDLRIRKALFTLIRICGDVVSLEDRIALSVGLLNHADNPRGGSAGESHSYHRFLGPRIGYSHEEALALPDIFKRGYLMVFMLQMKPQLNPDVLKNQKAFSCFGDFELIMRGFGRLIAIAVTVNSELPIALSLELWRSLHRDAVQLESIFYIRKGIRDILGPLGVSLFTPDEWDRLHMYLPM